MGIDATRSEGNTEKLIGYLEGNTAGIKCGMEIMKKIACSKFSEILGEICPEMVRTEDDIKAMENVFRKRLEE